MVWLPNMGGLVFGERPSGIRRDARGSCGADKRHPGVAFVYTSDVDLYPVQMKTQAAQKWAALGRMILACVKDERGCKTYVMNVYAPAGASLLSWPNGALTQLLLLLEIFRLR